MNNMNTNNTNNTNTMQVCRYQELSTIFYFSDCPTDVVKLIYEYKQHMEIFERSDLMVFSMRLKNKNNTAPNRMAFIDYIEMRHWSTTAFRKKPKKIKNKIRKRPSITMCTVCGNFAFERYFVRGCAQKALCFWEHGF